MKPPYFLMGASLLLIVGGSLFVARRQVLLALREPSGPVPGTATSYDVYHQNPTNVEAPSPVPMALLHLRAEYQALRRQWETTSNRLANLKHPRDFVPGSSASSRIQEQEMETMKDLMQDPRYQAAAVLGGLLAEHLSRHQGQLPTTLKEIEDSDSGRRADDDGGFELIHHSSVTQEQRRYTYIARSKEIALPSGDLARFFVKADGSVVVGTLPPGSHWTDWLEVQQAHEREASFP